MSSPLIVNRWLTARVVYPSGVSGVSAAGLAGDSAILTDVSASRGVSNQTKMFGIGRAGAIMLRAFGGDTDNLTLSGIQISGWMNPAQPNPHASGPGAILWEGDLVLGAGEVASPGGSDPRWALAEIIEGQSPLTWLEVDTWTATYNPFGAVAYDSQNPAGAADRDAMLVLPTLGYPHIFISVLSSAMHFAGSGKTKRAGFLWKPVVNNDVRLTF